MHVVHVVHQLPPETFGGVEVYVRDLALAQKRAGHEVDIIAGSLEPWDEVGGEEEETDGLGIYRVHRADLYFDSWDNMYCPEMAALVRRRIEATSPDVVHLHHWIRLSSDLGAQLTDAGVPFVATLHDLASSCPRAFRVRADGRACFEPLSVETCLGCVPRMPWQGDAVVAAGIEMFRRNSIAELTRARAVLCANRNVRDLLVESLAIEADRVRVLPLGYTRRFSGAPAPPAPDETFRFAYWGSITERKGVELLVDAFRSLVESRPADFGPVSLEVFGRCDRPEREAALRRAASGLPVTFHGAFEYEELERMGLDAAVFPSLCVETFGLVLDEAFELGLPVVVNDIGALPERAGDAGLVFETGNAGDLARKMGALADDEGIRRRLRAAVPESSSSPEDHLREILAIYEEARKMPPPSPLETVTPEERAVLAFRRHGEQFARLVELDRGGDRH